MSENIKLLQQELRFMKESFVELKDEIKKDYVLRIELMNLQKQTEKNSSNIRYGALAIIGIVVKAITEIV